ncbi:hypothetical protein ACQY1Q_15900 [Tenacibaculum sp. TC6]|uniref:hypothetical protein n=1 Tax=Tenacibaculum sp. TC6 TaxID=3423223 RepID=UPI003D3637C1
MRWNIRKLPAYFFGASCLLGSFIYFSPIIGVELPKYVRFYVNDLLIVPIVLTICLFVIRKLKRDSKYQLHFIYVMYVSLGYSVFFEYYLPSFHQRYTYDSIDILLYFVGGILFYYLQKVVRKEKQLHESKSI